MILAKTIALFMYFNINIRDMDIQGVLGIDIRER